jgi:hypothetical protein
MFHVNRFPYLGIHRTLDIGHGIAALPRVVNMTIVLTFEHRTYAVPCFGTIEALCPYIKIAC